MGMERMIQAGITPITWLAVHCEWQRDWARARKSCTASPEYWRSTAGVLVWPSIGKCSCLASLADQQPVRHEASQQGLGSVRAGPPFTRHRMEPGGRGHEDVETQSFGGRR
jgi:hypothetical protein